MATTQTTTPVNPKVVSPAPFDDLPEVESISLLKVKGGWVVLSITTQGNKVLKQEILNEKDEPQTFPHSSDLFKVEAAKRFIMGKG